MEKNEKNLEQEKQSKKEQAIKECHARKGY